MTAMMTRAELGEAYSDPMWRAKLLDALDLLSILLNCIIRRSYRPSENLNHAISAALTVQGKKVRDQLVTKEKVNAKDANILTFLGFLHVEPLIDLSTLDFDRLTSSISEEVREKHLRFPMIFGRHLYDRASRMFPEERDYLKHDDTMKLLGDSPQGVFQSGRYLIGPYGVISVTHPRALRPRTRIPLQHCADLSCAAVHEVQLSTSYEAGVNAGRRALSAVLDGIAPEPSEWNGFISDLLEEAVNPYSLDASATIPFLLGDGFSDEELAGILRNSKQYTNGRTFRQARALGAVTDGDFAADLTREQVLQLLLTESDESLTNLTDSLILDDTVRIPPGEIRRPVINHAASSGVWRMRAEASSLGVRGVSRDRRLSLQRLEALVAKLYRGDSEDDQEDLKWVLRQTPGSSPDEKLATFLRRTEPAKVIQSLVLSRRENTVPIVDQLGVRLDSTDEDFIERVLWKLGFAPTVPEDVRSTYWRLHTKLDTLTKTANVALDQSEETVRGVASNYFVALEKFLFDSLCYGTWALLSDHITSESAFTFYREDARDFTIATLNAVADGNDSRECLLTGEPTLSEIVTGFARLGIVLKSSSETPGDYRRPELEYPKWTRRTDLQKFPFIHKRPFLDLTTESQSQLKQVFGKISSLLNDSGIMTARNGLLHAKEEVPTVAKLNDSLSNARGALDLLEEIGCVRRLYVRQAVVTGRWGRSTTTLESEGRSIELSSPSQYEWVPLPASGRPQYLFHGAVFAPPNEMLRFHEGYRSQFRDYWSDFPRRPERGNRLVPDQSAGVATPMESGEDVPARAD